MEVSRRAFSVLCAIVELYTRSGEPVASRQVARYSDLGLSPATMRNIMAELEEGGFLTRPHASAGRIPSDSGFRLFVDNLPSRSAPPPAVRRQLAGRMATMRRELAEDIEWVAQLVAEVTREAGVAIRPLGAGPAVEAVSLVLLENQRVLGVVIADDGTVEKRVLEFEPEVTREDLQSLSNVLTKGLAGTSLHDVPGMYSKIDRLDEQDVGSDLRLQAERTVRRLFSSDAKDVEVRIVGTENLLATSDFSEIGRVRSLLTALEDHTRIASEIRRAFTRGRTQVLIGAESETTAGGDLGIIATLYFKDSRRAGAVGVVGPRRMDYQRIVPVVEYIGDSLTEMLGASGAMHG
jgi:heat-inducible transcriptional repressor